MVQTSRWPISRLPISNIQPFTYRDGETYLSLLNRLAEYITTQIHPNLRQTVQEMMDELEHVLADQHQLYVTGIQDFQRIHDAFMEDVNSALTALNDNAVADLADDPGSALGGTLRSLMIDTVHTVEVNVGQQPYNVEPDTAISATVNQAIRDVNARGGGVVVIPAGQYWVDTTELIRLLDGVTLKLHQKAVLRALPSDRGSYKIIQAENVSDVAVTGGRIVGERHEHLGDAGEWGMGIDFRGVQRGRIHDVTVESCWGDGVYIGKHGDNTSCSDIHITNSIFDDNRRQGVSVIAAHNVFIENNRFSRTLGTRPGAGVDLEPNTGDQVSNSVIRGNVFDGNNLGIVVFGKSGPVIDTVISDNIVLNSHDIGIRATEVDGVIVANNIVKNSDYMGINIVGSSRSTVTGNRVLESGGHGIQSIDSDHNTITGNTVVDSSQQRAHFGINVSNGLGCSVQNNSIVGGVGGVGLLDDGSHHKVENNTIYDISGNGVQIYTDSTTPGHKISLNSFDRIGGYGVTMVRAPRCIVLGNDFSNVNDRLVNIAGSEGVRVSSNSFHSQEDVYGVFVGDTSENTMVTNNDFLQLPGVAIRDLGTNTTTTSENRM